MHQAASSAMADREAATQLLLQGWRASLRLRPQNAPQTGPLDRRARGRAPKVALPDFQLGCAVRCMLATAVRQRPRPPWGDGALFRRLFCRQDEQTSVGRPATLKTAPVGPTPLPQPAAAPKRPCPDLG